MFTIELTENECLLLIFALGCAYNVPPIIAHRDERPANSFELAARIISRSSGPPPAAPASAPAPPQTAPAKAPRPIPADAKSLTIIPFAITKSGAGERERLVVEWKEASSTKKASCWTSSRDIWPRLLERVKQQVVILVVENKGYLNIVGVK